MSFGEQKNGIVLDFFAGSGTSGHAVTNHNYSIDANLQFILIQLPEPFDENNAEQKIATQIIGRIGKPKNISELTKERLRRAGAKIKAENPLFQGDTGFRVFKLASSNIQAWDTDAANLETNLLTGAEHLVQGRTEQDVLYELLLKLGLDLCTPLETKVIAAKTVYSVGKGRLIACLDNKIDCKAIAPLAQGLIDWHSNLGASKDATIIFRDSGFVDDVAKTNLAETLKQAGLTNLRSL
jgi:adenine-specific DNA-methyltransferase